MAHQGPRRRDIPDPFLLFRQRVAGMSRDLGSGRPGIWVLTWDIRKTLNTTLRDFSSLAFISVSAKCQLRGRHFIVLFSPRKQ